eukprot:TRINITY_DN10685_c0_g1_i1.p1 TRINITY_DN10685_c0_g1~~TRINITY_DN10685_c0_g1_i1.p1  ORF type:complete len:594 (+),score=111.60 TRINITY_DN10685_c0_g1_i1:98-1879(+)
MASSTSQVELLELKFSEWQPSVAALHARFSSQLADLVANFREQVLQSLVTSFHVEIVDPVTFVLDSRLGSVTRAAADILPAISKSAEQLLDKRRILDQQHQYAVTIQSAVRRFLAVRRYKRLLKRLKHRTRVAEELISTERTYVKCLHVLNEVFYAQLRGRSGPFPGTLCATEDVPHLFANIDQVYKLHLRILLLIEGRLSAWSNRQCLGDIFLQLVPFMRYYRDYVNNYDQALSTLTTLRRKDAFVSWLRETEARVECAGQSVDSLLVTPIQRIPRYQMLMRELVEHTEHDHPDYADLCGALANIKEVAEYLNESKRNAENTARVRQVAEVIHGRLPIALAEPGRRLVREGAMMVRDDCPAPQQRMLFLFNDVLVVAARRLFSSQEYVCKACIQLFQAVVRDLEDGAEGGEPMFDLVTPTRKVTFLPESHDDKHAWLADLRVAVASTADRRRSVAMTKVVGADAGPLYDQILSLHALMKPMDLTDFVQMMWNNVDRSDVQAFMQRIADIRGWLSCFENRRQSSGSTRSTALARVGKAVHNGHVCIMQLNRALLSVCPRQPAFTDVHVSRELLLRWYMEELFAAWDPADDQSV